mmetsp:Transcript_19081/g.28861  ORF Transcript_19081/g.28861 Transcript_19081/m.28861 type:complete len:448 (-) Transcript_19081:788-2131(-)
MFKKLLILVFVGFSKEEEEMTIVPAVTMAPTATCECDVCQKKLTTEEIVKITMIWVFAVVMSFAIYCITKKCDKERELRIIESFNRSGVLVILWLCMWGFLIPFNLLLASSRPCATALGDCSTISCVSGNRYIQGYVFMFVSLTLIAVLLLKDLSDDVLFRQMSTVHSNKRDPYFKTIKAAIVYFAVVLGLLTITLTAVFPTISHDAYGGANDQAPAERKLVLLAGLLHIIGILAGCTILFFVPLICSSYTHEIRKRGKNYGIGRFLMAIIWMAYAILFALGYYLADDHDKIHNYCHFAETRTECQNFPNHLDGSCLLNERPFLYECEWFTGIQSTIADDYCRKKTCKLEEHARIMVLEFCLLIITLLNFVYFGLHDSKAFINMSNNRLSSSPSHRCRDIHPRIKQGHRGQEQKQEEIVSNTSVADNYEDVVFLDDNKEDEQEENTV